MERPALKEMLRDIRGGKLNCVLAYKIDRLTRSVKDFHVLMDIFDRCGVKFVSVTLSCPPLLHDFFKNWWRTACDEGDLFSDNKPRLQSVPFALFV